MKRLWLLVAGFVLYAVLVVVAGFFLHLQGTRLFLFDGLLIVLGAAACGQIYWYLNKVEPLAPSTANAGNAGNLDTLLRDANAKLVQSGRADLKSLAALPLVYVIGDENSAKTQTVLKSGLEVELLAGQVFRDQALTPTQTVNIWLAGSLAIVEAGGALLRQPALWEGLIRKTAPGKLGAAFSRSALQPTRAVVLCVSLERILAPNTTEQIRALAQTMNQRLREVAQTLGISLPVYVLFTKLDTVPAFAEYTANLTSAEASTPVGAMLSRQVGGAGLYAEGAAQEIGAHFDQVTFLLSEFRLELLARGGEAATAARSYEFPRDLRKLRSGIVDFLVEVGRPSQLGVNPFLRGFFFSGMRAHLVEDMLSVGMQSAAPAPSTDANATQVFSFGQRPAPAPVPMRAGGAMRKVAQWVFLPYFFSRLVFTDETALASSRASTRVSGVKRLLAAVGCGLLAMYLLCLSISFVRNRSIEQRAAVAAAALPASGHVELASVRSLQSLDDLRQVLVQLDGYEKDGPPLMDRWGLYRGAEIRAAACRSYGEGFRAALLGRAQADIVTELAALPAKAGPADEYQAAYKPLRAWLITTSNPEKSTTDFLPPVLAAEWARRGSVSPEQQQLAFNQFDYYAANLSEPGSCLAGIGGRADTRLVANTRAYLNSFAGIDHVYLSMKSAADRKFTPIDFKKLYPNSVRLVSAPTIVDGAFSKGGFGFMQDAINHPDPYLSGEEWVTGPATANVDRASLRQQLADRYQSDFLNAWRSFLKTAHVLPFSSPQDAAEKLHDLDGPGSPLLQIFGVVARNTAVSNTAFSQPFQAPQSVVPAGNGPAVNPGYTEKLGAIEQAMHQMLSAPANANDPTAVNAAVGAAYQTVSTIRGGFQPPDPSGVADANSERLLREPIHAVEDVAGKLPAKAANSAGADFCKQASGVLGKFPFNPDAKQDVSPEDAAAFFSPTGPIAQFTAAQSKLITFNGVVYTAASGASVNPSLLNFLNETRTVASLLFPNGSIQPSLSFTITQEPTPNLPPASLDIDGTSSAAPGASTRVNWLYKPQGSVKLAGAGQTKNNFGPWVLFHFAYTAKHPSPNQLEYIFQNNGITEKASNGTPIIYRFDIGDAGSRLLVPEYMRRQLHCVATVAK